MALKGLLSWSVDERLPLVVVQGTLPWLGNSYEAS